MRQCSHFSVCNFFSIVFGFLYCMSSPLALLICFTHMHSTPMWTGKFNPYLMLVTYLAVVVPEVEIHAPELFTHKMQSGEILYAMLFRPHGFQHGRKYPVNTSFG